MTPKKILTLSANQAEFMSANNKEPLTIILNEKKPSETSTPSLNFRIYEKNRFDEFQEIAELLPNVSSVDIFTMIPETDYFKYIDSELWKRRKDEYFAGYKRVCSICGSTDNIELHHLNYDRMSYERDADLRPLCADCHKAIHSYLDAFKSRAADLQYAWGEKAKNITNAANNITLIKGFIYENRAALEFLFEGLDPIKKSRKMQFIKTLRDSIEGIHGRRYPYILPHVMIAKLIPAKS